MSGISKDLTDAQLKAFLADNNTGFLAFAGDEPYVIPLGYKYRQGTVLLTLVSKPWGRKMTLLERNSRICFTICRTRAQTNLKHPCTTVIMEGELEAVTDRAYYGLGEFSEKGQEEFRPIGYRIKPTSVSGHKCTRKPCELMVPPAAKS